MTTMVLRNIILILEVHEIDTMRAIILWRCLKICIIAIATNNVHVPISLLPRRTAAHCMSKIHTGIFTFDSLIWPTNILQQGVFQSIAVSSDCMLMPKEQITLVLHISVINLIGCGQSSIPVVVIFLMGAHDSCDMHLVSDRKSVV